MPAPPTPAGTPGGACRRCLRDVLWDGLDAVCGLAGVLGAVCARALCAVLCFFAVVYAGKSALALLLIGAPDHSLVDWSPASVHVLHVIMGAIVWILLWCCCGGACAPPP